ncbi:MAG: ADP-ribosylglycohydrolase family protein [Deltaproteobacteria bacterium]|nr:ADP-ribosylglycohydrolase family protein [Deltaproteobacteria bacterium]
MCAAPALDRVRGLLLGTAVGDALGLPAEGLSPRTIARRFGALDRYRLLGRTGFVSDDTEQAALVAQSLLHARGDVDAARRAFRAALRGWFLCLPFGIGLATLRACLRLLLGLQRSGVHSAGNGAAMRMAVVGAYAWADVELRRRLATALAEVTHLDERAVEGAVFVASVAAGCLVAAAPADRQQAVAHAVAAVRAPELRTALQRALALADARAQDAAHELGTDGFVLRSLPWATWCLLTHGDRPVEALRVCIRGGGDTDTNAAILGAWLGALHGAAALPEPLVTSLAPGPFGRDHLDALAGALCAGTPPPRYRRVLALLRNLALYPVILAHGFRRLLPF